MQAGLDHILDDWPPSGCSYKSYIPQSLRWLRCSRDEWNIPSRRRTAILATVHTNDNSTDESWWVTCVRWCILYDWYKCKSLPSKIPVFTWLQRKELPSVPGLISLCPLTTERRIWERGTSNNFLPDFTSLTLVLWWSTNMFGERIRTGKILCRYRECSQVSQYWAGCAIHPIRYRRGLVVAILEGEVRGRETTLSWCGFYNVFQNEWHRAKKRGSEAESSAMRLWHSQSNTFSRYQPLDTFSILHPTPLRKYRLIKPNPLTPSPRPTPVPPISTLSRPTPTLPPVSTPLCHVHSLQAGDSSHPYSSHQSRTCRDDFNLFGYYDEWLVELGVFIIYQLFTKRLAKYAVGNTDDALNLIYVALLSRGKCFRVVLIGFYIMI